MALNIFAFFNPRANSPDANYPSGSFKDRSLPGAFDGTPLLADDRNDLLGFTDALLEQGGVARSGDPDTAVASDRMNALNNIIRYRTDALPLIGGGQLDANRKYWIRDSGTYVLQDVAGLSDGDSIECAWERPSIPIINVFGAPTIMELPNGFQDNTLECDLITWIKFYYNAADNKWEIR